MSAQDTHSNWQTTIKIFQPVASFQIGTIGGVSHGHTQALMRGVATVMSGRTGKV